MELTSEIKAQLEEQKKDCIFCKILSGEMPSEFVYKDDLIFGILDINPCVKGHTLLMPKEHYPIMPLIPAETFKHLFGKLSSISGAVKNSMLGLGLNVFIANGGVAGQQSAHFLVHIIPREPKDKISKFNFKCHTSNGDMQVISNNLPIMMSNHFKRNPGAWHTGNFEKYNVGDDMLLYEDEKVVCIAPSKSLCKGHIIVYSKEEDNHFEKLSEESSAHLFFTASFCSTAVFEAFKAHGSNIILKSGVSDDNPEKRLQVHIFPRWSEDGLDFLNPPLPEQLDLKSIFSKIRDKMFLLEHKAKEKVDEVVEIKPEVRVEIKNDEIKKAILDMIKD